MSNTAVILAAGNGTRMKANKSKLLLDLRGKTVIEHTVSAFSQARSADDVIDDIIVVCRESDISEYKDILQPYNVKFCIGGATRQQSVCNAVEYICSNNIACDYIVIHDGARPLVTEAEIKNTIQNAVKFGASAVGVPVKDTIKIVDGDRKIIDTPERSSLIAIQTPQIFRFDTYKAALDTAQSQGLDFTDDCKLFENIGKSVYVTIGEYTNIKITTPEDIPAAEAILKMRG